MHLDADAVHADGHTLRVFTNDDEGEQAWVFFDDDALNRSPRTLSYLLHDEPTLPDGDADRPFAAPPVQAIRPAGVGEGTTYACLLTFHDRHSIPGRAVAIPGARMLNWRRICAGSRRPRTTRRAGRSSCACCAPWSTPATPRSPPRYAAWRPTPSAP